MFDHVEYQVSDYRTVRTFYSSCLAPLGWRLIKDEPAAGVLGYSPDRFVRLHLTALGRVMPLLHVAFAAQSPQQVDDFFAAGLGAGGRGNGAPGVRAYGTPYYAAFLLDPDGHNIEAVFRGEAR